MFVVIAGVAFKHRRWSNVARRRQIVVSRWRHKVRYHGTGMQRIRPGNQI